MTDIPHLSLAPEPKNGRIKQWQNEYGVTVAEYRCHKCGEIYEVTPAPDISQDAAWFAGGCMGEDCETRDESQIVDGDYLIVQDGQLTPINVIDGGKND